MSQSSLLCASPRDVGECVVKIGGEDIKKYYPNLTRTIVSLKSKGSAEASLSFTVLREGESWDMENESFLNTWKKIEILAVFGEDQNPFFSGYIKEINTETGESGNTGTITLVCQDIFSIMDRNCKKESWSGNPNGINILNEILKQYPLILKTAIKKLPLTDILKKQTDFRFIRDLAQKYGYEWYIRATDSSVKNELHFDEMKISPKSSLPKIMIRAGRDTNCFSFNINFDGYRPDGIVYSTSPVDGTRINITTKQPDLQALGTHGSDSSDRGLENFQWCLPPGDLTNNEQAIERSRGKANANSFKHKATGKLDGISYGALLLPGVTVEVGGAGKNNGKWYVDTTSHTFDSSGYFIDFELIRNAAAGLETSCTHKLAGLI